MKPSHSLIGLTSLCLAAVLALWLWPKPAPDDTIEDVLRETGGTGTVETEPRVADSISESVATTTTSKMATSLPRKVEPASLPDFDTPFRESFDALLEATLAGNSEAACRLVGEAQRCMAAKFQLRLLPEPTPPAPIAESSSRDPLEDSAKRSMQRLQYEYYEQQLEQRRIAARAFEACEGVDISPAARSYYMQIAAEAGEVHSRLEYALGRHLSTRRLLEEPQLLEQYRRNARRYFMDALEAGDLDAVTGLWGASNELFESPLSPFLPEEWTEQGFAAALIQQMTEAQRIAVFAGMNPLERDEIEPSEAQRENARAFYQQYLADSPAESNRWTPGIPEPGSDPLEPTRRLLNTGIERCR